LKRTDQAHENDIPALVSFPGTHCLFHKRVIHIKTICIRLWKSAMLLNILLQDYVQKQDFAGVMD